MSITVASALQGDARARAQGSTGRRDFTAVRTSGDFQYLFIISVSDQYLQYQYVRERTVGQITADTACGMSMASTSVQVSVAPYMRSPL
ncbi:hypothetical protein A0H81_14372 [Grifola frondosa]|uniref:Uncharacterized protein n=1 Tax=Grifola frondosa TaxID=5627 RepID=A0A1C7LNH4_GRIFR|nr:hypothetical protein A0H81_14372 [Grifola frondosa]